MRRTLVSILLSVGLAACAGSNTSSDPGPGGSKADDPGSAANSECREQCGSSSGECFTQCRDDKALEHCELRRSDAVSSSQRAFTETAIRWACADVEGVNTVGGDDRGQEYCEYFATVQLPPEAEGGELPAAVHLGRGGATSVELTSDQIFAFEDEPAAVVGQCVFTSWHADISDPYPACSDGSCDIAVPSDKMASYMSEPELKGISLSERLMRMQGGINSNGAAADLVERCLAPVTNGDPANADDPRHDTYLRGCLKTYELFKTEWRRSDPSVCVGAMRLRECGCGIDTDADGVADITDPSAFPRALVPRQPVDGQITLRGFRLGTWDGESSLPSGCRFADTGDDSQTAVLCDLTADDVITGANDLKQTCRDKYGANVVVHVPVPGGALVCNPPEGDYAGTCGEVVPFAAPQSAE